MAGGIQMSESTGRNARIQRMLERLSLSGPAAMILAALAVAVSFYFLQARPLASASAEARQQDATERVLAKVDGLLSQIERSLQIMQDSTQDDPAGLVDARLFNRLMMPVITRHAIVSSVHLATDEGREILLLKMPDGWKNRMTDVPAKGKQQHWLMWKDARTSLGDEWK